jgi:phytoene dehydrogenase-like protein
VTGGPANLDLAKSTVRESRKLPQWMSEHGAYWQPPLAGTLHLGRTNRWFLGGGKALINAYYQTARRMGISVRYDSSVDDLAVENGHFEAATVKCQGIALAQALGDAFGLQYLKGGGPGCYYPKDEPSAARRIYHSFTSGVCSALSYPPLLRPSIRMCFTGSLLSQLQALR